MSKNVVNHSQVSNSGRSRGWCGEVVPAIVQVAVVAGEEVR